MAERQLRERKRQAAEAVLDLPGVIASFRLNGAQDDYRLHGTNRMGLVERLWFRRHGEELVDTMAAPYGPDVVALLETDVTYGTKGDHGGHNRLIQNIPMIFAGPGVGSRDSYGAIAVDVLPTVLETMERLQRGGPRRRGGAAAPPLGELPLEQLGGDFSPRRRRSVGRTT